MKIDLMIIDLTLTVPDTVKVMALVLVIMTVVVHVAFALAVSRDAERLSREGAEPTFVSSRIWAVATLLGGILTAAIYWIIHHSTLRRAAAQSGEDKAPTGGGEKPEDAEP